MRVLEKSTGNSDNLMTEGPENPGPFHMWDFAISHRIHLSNYASNGQVSDKSFAFICFLNHARSNQYFLIQ